MRVSKEIREKAVDYGFESIKYICEEIGPRESGMPNERKAQEWLKDQLLTNGWADEAVIEDFTVSRHGLVGFTKIVSVLLVLAAAIQFVGYFVTAAAMWCHIVTIVLAALSFTITVLEFLMYKPFIDPFLPKTTSGNVYARYKSAGETKRRIIFSGHCDSAYEWTLMKIKPAFMITVIVMCVVGVLASVALCIYGAVKGATPVWSLVVTMVFVPFYVLLYFFCTFKVVVPGANDNLTGVLASVGVLKCLKESGIRFENTEVDVVLTGSEEAGLRGAKEWAKAHKNDYNDVPTFIIAYDTIHEGKFLQVNQKDLNATVKADAEISRRFKEAADKLGITCNVGNVPFGATDSAAFNQGGFRATGITAMNHNLQNYYHTRYDSYDNLDKEALADCFAVSVQVLEDLENHGADK